MSGSNERPATSAWISPRQIAASARANGAVWSLTSADLNMNVVVISADSPIQRHLNREVDVVVVAVDGQGVVKVDEEEFRLGPPEVLVIPKGTWRSIQPVGASFAYMTIHRRRAGLWPTSLRPEG
ncbi:MAG TPA: AraC family ligand binding domain-containing protein [Thermomicrobiales bacterium]|nr:AraC family ligand binding domain-containing protein [Thermomicrobiales bacterium]